MVTSILLSVVIAKITKRKQNRFGDYVQNIALDKAPYFAISLSCGHDKELSIVLFV